MRRRLSVGAFVLAALMIGACGDDVTVEQLTEPTNQAPSIIAQGPEYPPDAIETRTGSGLDLWVLVGDPDGLDDISTVLFSVESIVWNRAILRPVDDPMASCPAVSFVDNDTLGTSVLSLLPSALPGPENVPMSQIQGGLYESFSFCFGGFSVPPCPLTTDAILSSSASLGHPLWTCLAATEYLAAFGVYPPAVSTQLDAFVTYADISYTGITATVYDAAGASAVATFPDLRVVYEGDLESRAAP